MFVEEFISWVRISLNWTFNICSMKPLKSILLVEDDEVDAYISDSILKRHFNDFEVVRVKNGEEALKYLETNHPDLIILDLNMPVMNGRQFLEKSLQIRHARDIKVAVLTSSNNSSDKSECTRFGVENYFEKPLNASITTALGRMLDLY